MGLYTFWFWQGAGQPSKKIQNTADRGGMWEILEAMLQMSCLSRTAPVTGFIK